MRVLSLLAVLLMAIAPIACGGGGESTDEEFEKRVQEYLQGPDPEPPPGPAPKKLVFEDLKIGSGPAARRGDTVAIHYIAEGYESGATFSRRWEPDPPVVYERLGEGPYGRVEHAIEGMRAGGRRQAIVSNYARFPLIYVIELERLVPRGKPAQSS